MMSGNQLEEVLPFPLKLEINCDMDDLNMAIRDVVDDLVIEHNKKYETKIDGIVYHACEFDDGSDLDWNEYTFSVGEKIVLKGSPDFSSCNYDKNMEHYKSLIPLISQVMDDYHDDIVRQQEINEEKIKEYEWTGYDEILYFYYAIQKDRKAFKHLKKLAMRYPDSRYRQKYRGVYLDGRFGICRSPKMADKLSRARRVRRKNF